MRGTRYGDFSRFTFDAAKDFSGVLLQQGRVQLDADANEGAALVDHRLRVAVNDLLGGSCAPGLAPGFALRPRLALHFDGSDRLALAQAPRLAATRGGDERTLELWLRWEGGSGVIVDCGDSDGLGHRLAIDHEGFVALEIASQDDGGWPTATRLQASRPLVVNQLAHVAVVLAPDFAAISLDGLQVARDAHDGLRTLAGPALVLGGPVDDTEDPDGGGFVGLMGGVRLWGTTLTPAELATPEAAAAPQAPTADTGQPAGLLAVWPFDAHAGGPLLVDAVAGVQATPSREPRWRLIDLHIGAGRFYVDGVLCEQRQPGRYTRQPGGAPPLPVRGRHLAYLEVWEETVTAVQDPSIAEVALGGLDTAVRTRVTGRVRLTEAGDLAARPDEGELRAALMDAAVRPTGRLAADHVGSLAPGNRLYRVELHTDGELRSEEDDERGMSAGRRPAHRPTFKWSRDNGASLFAVVPVGHESESLDVLRATPGVEPLDEGDLVEPLAEHDAGPGGTARSLLRVVSVSEPDGRIVLDARVPAGVAYLRRWDHDEDPDAVVAESRRSGAELPVRPGWIELEDGIRVRFTTGTYRRGDFWWIVARADTRTIAWPCEHGHPVALAPSGVERLMAPLAVVGLDGPRVEVRDVRRIVRAVVAERPDAAAATPPEEEQDDLDALVAPDDAEPGDERRDDEPDTDADADRVEDDGDGDDGPDPFVANGDTAGIADALEPEAEGDDTPDPFGAGDDDLPPIEPAPEHAPEPDPEPEPGTDPEPTPDAAVTAEPPAWMPLSRPDLPGDRLQGVVSVGGALVAATGEQLFAVAPATGETRRLKDLPVARRGLQLTATGDLVVAVGGATGTDDPDGRVFALDLSSGAWSERTRMPVRGEHPAVASVGGQVHALGGRRAGRIRGGVHDEHHVYDPSANAWHEGPDLPSKRSGAAAVTVGTRLHVLGGHGAGRPPQLSVAHEVLDLERGTWATAQPVPLRVPVAGACVHRGDLAVLLSAPPTSGEAQPALTFGAGGWRRLPDLPELLGRPIVVGHEDAFHVLGTGQDGAVVVYVLA